MLVIKNKLNGRKLMKTYLCILTFTHRRKCCFGWTDLRFSNEDQKMHEIFVFTVVEEET